MRLAFRSKRQFSNETSKLYVRTSILTRVGAQNGKKEEILAVGVGDSDTPC